MCPKDLREFYGIISGAKLKVESIHDILSVNPHWPLSRFFDICFVHNNVAYDIPLCPRAKIRTWDLTSISRLLYQLSYARMRILGASESRTRAGAEAGSRPRSADREL